MKSTDPGRNGSGELAARLRALSPRQRAELAARLRPGPAAQQLVAYVVLKAEGSPAELREFIGARLPDYMVPAHVVVLDALPLTPNGKVDRRALPDPAEAAAPDGAEFIAPRNELEKAVAEVWSELLGADLIDVRDNFFELGGHSLSVMQMAARLRQRFDVAVPVNAFFEAPTLEGMAARIAAARLTAAGHPPAEGREEIEL